MANISEAPFPFVEMPISRTKRAHKKTRTGRAVCKRRRVKCDERRPRCHRCQLKGLNCSYSEARPVKSTERCHTVDTENETGGQGFESSHRFSSGSCPPATGLNDPELVSEAELAQHYFSHTMHTIAASSMDERQSKIWQIFIPSQGLSCPVVRRGMLVIAAMCLHKDSTADRSDGHSSKYLETAEAHSRTFVRESRQKMQDFCQSEFDSILACSRLLCVLGFAFNQTHRRNGATLADAEIWTWLRLVRGVKATWLAVSSSGLAFNDIVAQDMNSKPNSAKAGDRTPCEGLGYRHTAFAYFEKTRWERFEALQTFFEASKAFLGEQEVEDISDAIEKLGHCTEQICSQEAPSLFRIICRWPSHIADGCVDLILEGFPLALVVYAHWLMSVILVEDLWWVNDMGRAGIREVVITCSDNSDDVQGLLRWPREMVTL